MATIPSGTAINLDDPDVSKEEIPDTSTSAPVLSDLDTQEAEAQAELDRATKEEARLAEQERLLTNPDDVADIMEGEEEEVVDQSQQLTLADVPPIQTDFSGGKYSGVSFAVDKVAPPSVPQLEGVAFWMNLAEHGADTGIGSVGWTAKRVLDLIGGDEHKLTYGPSKQEFDTFMENARGLSVDRRRELMLEALESPELSLKQKLEVSREMMGPQEYDFNIINRAALHNLNAVNAEDTSPAGMDTFTETSGWIEALPRHIENPVQDVATATKQDPKVVMAAFQLALRVAREQADATRFFSGEGALEFAGALIPYRQQLIVNNIYSKLGIDLGVDVAKLAMGEAIRTIREHIVSLKDKPEELVEALRVVLNELTPNKGVFEDANDFIASHLLDEFFYEYIYGKEYHTKASLEEQAKMNSLLKAQDDAKANGDYVKMAALQAQITNLRATAGGYFDGDKPQSWMQLIDNMTSLLDGMAVGSIVKNTLVAGRRFLPRSLRRMNKVAPDVLAKQMADAINRPDMAAIFPNMTAMEILEFVMPSLAPAAKAGGVQGLPEVIDRAYDGFIAMHKKNAGQNLSAAERAAGFQELKQQMSRFALKPGSVLRLADSAIGQTDTGYTITAVYGRNRHQAYATLREAQDGNKNALDGFLGKDAKTEVVMRDASGELVPVPSGTSLSAKGEFYVRATDDRAFGSTKNMMEDLMWDGKGMSSSTLGGVWSWLKSAGSMLAPETFNRMALSAQQRIAFNDIGAGMMKLVDNLDRKQFNMLSDTLKDGEKINPLTGRGTVYTPAELAARGLTDEGIAAYQAYRSLTDVLYHISNREVRTQYLREGIMDIYLKDGGRVGFAKPLRMDAAMGDIAEAAGQGRGAKMYTYDPLTNTYHILSPADLENLYQSGKSVAKLKTPMLSKGADEATHVIVSPKDGMKVLPAPKNVLPRIEGYYPHMWNGNYVVYGVTHAGSRVALGIANTAKDADAAVADIIQSMSTAKDGPKFTKVEKEFDRSLTESGRRGSVMDDIYVNMGGPVFGERNGGVLRNLSPQDGDLMVDPIVALLRAIDVVGHTVTKGALESHMRTRLYNHLVAIGKITPNSGVTPATLSKEMLKGIKMGTDVDPMVRQAQIYMQEIDTLRYVPDHVDSFMSGFFQWTSGIFAKIGFGAGEQAALRMAAKGTDPLAIAVGMVHRMTIASAPVAQLALQASQSIMALGISPTGYAKAVAQSSIVANLVGMRAMFMHGGSGKYALTRTEFISLAHKIAPKIGYKPDELVDLIDTLMNSGFINSTSHHTAMRSSLQSLGQERMGATARSFAGRTGATSARARNLASSADELTYGTLSKIGFEAGENINRIITYLTLYNKDRANKVANLKSPDYVNRLIGRSTELTGSMIQELAYGYQRSWLKVSMQYASFQHKMVQMFLPDKLGGSRQFTDQEKLGLAFSQLLMFGRRGAAHFDALYRIIEREVDEREAELGANDPAVREWREGRWAQLIHDGLFDIGLNMAVRQLTGADEEFAFGARFAPGGGSEFLVEKAILLFGDGGSHAERYFGVAGRKYSQVADFYDRVQAVTLAKAMKMDEDVSIGERAEELMQSGLGLAFNFYGKYLTAQVADTYGAYIGAGGKHSEGFSGEVEKALAQHFGVNSKDRESFFAARDKFDDGMLEGGTSGSGRFAKKEQELQRIANLYLSATVSMSTKFAEQSTTEEHYNLLYGQWMRQQSLLLSFLPREDLARVNEIVTDRISKMWKSKDSSERQFVERVVGKAKDGVFGSKSMEALVVLRNADFVKSNPALRALVENVVGHSMGEKAREDAILENVNE